MKSICLLYIAFFPSHFCMSLFNCTHHFPSSIRFCGSYITFFLFPIVHVSFHSSCKARRSLWRQAETRGTKGTKKYNDGTPFEWSLNSSFDISLISVVVFSLISVVIIFYFLFPLPLTCFAPVVLIVADVLCLVVLLLTFSPIPFSSSSSQIFFPFPSHFFSSSYRCTQATHTRNSLFPPFSFL